jgi:putative aminopeptidase FrvX
MSEYEPERELHEEWLFALTCLPTAAGRERRVIEWIEAWVDEREGVALERDVSGNMTLSLVAAEADGAPVYFTAHMDHPAFVVTRIVAPTVLELEFRGGVMDDYFLDARIVIHAGEGTERIEAVVTENTTAEGAAFKSFLAELDAPSDAISTGDVATWDLPEQGVEDGVFYTNVCDDLAAAAAALAALDTIRLGGGAMPDVRVLLTRAEEIGFIGAIAACKNGTTPLDARLICLENSRSFADSPIGGGPIVRVGDRLSIFDPALTAAVAKCAETIAGAPASPTASQKNAEVKSAWRWQRKLMAGGACEATVFCAAGLQATCVCLPLGNYHNMADLAAVQAGENTSRPRVGREHIALSDFHGLVDLLVACGTSLPEASPIQERLDKLWMERRVVLDEV